MTQLKEWRHAIGPLFDTPAITHSKAAFVQISPADERCRINELVICNDSTSHWPARPASSSRSGQRKLD